MTSAKKPVQRFSGEWETKSVSEFGNVVTGATPSTKVNTFWNGPYPWITPTDITSERDMTVSERMITQEGLNAIRTLPPNTVLVTCIASIGKNAILRTIGSCNQQINAVIPNSAHSAEFLYYLFQYNANYLLANAGITATNIVSKATFSNLVFKVPSLPEQRAIAEVLSDVDGLLNALDALIAKKRAIKQATMQQLLTGKTRLPGFSGAWETKRLGDVAQIKTGSKNNEDKDDNGQYPLYVRSAVVERINSYCFDGEAILVPGEGGIENIFHYINGRFDCHQRVYMINQFANDVFGKLIYYIMVLQFGKHAMKNTVKATVDSLRLPTFQTFSFSIPKDVAEQRAIASVLSDMDAEITALEQRRNKTSAIKQGMMQQLLTGRVRLSESRICTDDTD